LISKTRVNFLILSFEFLFPFSKFNRKGINIYEGNFTALEIKSSLRDIICDCHGFKASVIEEQYMSSNQSENEKHGLFNLRKWSRWSLLAAFVVISIFTAYMLYNTVQSITLTTTAVDLPGLAILHTPTSSPGEESTPEPGVAPQILPELESWDGASRVTVIFMGLDFRDWAANEGPPRTDTMILFTIDPVSKTGGILNIRRDLWVNIPGFGHGKINTAYQLGEGAQLPGGGPGLVIKTVEQFLGIKIHYFAQVDFDAFVRFIDHIGGVKINVPENVVIDIIGRPHPITIKPGIQTFPGEYALAYARARNTEGGDFDRAQRQQLMIFGIRNQLLRPDVQAVLISTGLSIYQDVSSGITTNLTFDEIFKLGVLASQIGLEDIHSATITTEQIAFEKSPDGLDILKPITEKIRILRDEVFSAPAAFAQGIVSNDPAELMNHEGAKISILNGASAEGLAATTQDYFISLGFDVVEVGNASPENFTTIVDLSGNPYTVKYLKDLMVVRDDRVRWDYTYGSLIDVQIILGSDWANSNPMP
jgi:LCP family protein required for cell wall assembly